MKLAEILQSSESAIEGAIMFIDISDSTAMKERESEATWLATYALFFDLARKHIEDTQGNIVKYLGDGLMAFYDMDSVANAINASIHIQEDLNQATLDRHFFVSCTIGISEGRMRTFKTENGTVDYIGNIVDKAARLGSVASPKAIFVDTNTVNSAAMNKVQSQRGKISNWSVDDYIGEQQKIILKGFKQSVSYYEVKWDTQAYGVKSQYTTDSLDKEQPQNKNTPTITKNSTPRPERRTGTAGHWIDEKACCFISDSTNGKNYYTNTRYVIDGIKPQKNNHVYFIEGSPLKADAAPLAMAVAVIGNTYKGKVKFVNYKDASHQLASIELSDSHGNILDIFAYLGNNHENIRASDLIEFELNHHAKGPSAMNIKKIPT